MTCYIVMLYSKSIDFNKLTLEKKILDLNSKLVSAAKQANVDLPR